MSVKSIKERFRAKRAGVARRRPELPVVTGPRPCPDCWTRPGEPHQPSCEQVSFEQFMAFVGGTR